MNGESCHEKVHPTLQQATSFKLQYSQYLQMDTMRLLRSRSIFNLSNLLMKKLSKTLFFTASMFVLLSMNISLNQKQDGGFPEVLENSNFLKSTTFTYEVVSPLEYERLYSEWPWMHIGRLESLNAGVDLRNIDSSTIFSKIQFNHKSNFVYRLYNGDFLICKILNK